MKLEELPIEEVEWEDHYSTDRWTEHEDPELNGSIFVKTVGYKLKETKTKIILVQNSATNGQISGTMTIIKKTVKSRNIIREGK